MDKQSKFDKSDMKFIGLNIVLAIVVGIVILVSLLLWLKSYTQHGIEVEVADLTGMYVQEAEPVLAQSGLQLQVIDSTYTNKVPFGTIVEQSPKANSHAKHGRVVYVTINATTKPQVILPNMQDISYRQAETTLRGMGLVVDTVYEYQPSEFRDLVLDIKVNGESKQPGDKIAQGTKIKLVVGKGRGTEQVTVPSVVGLSLKDARSLLLGNRLIVGVVSYDEEKQREDAEPMVYKQIPAAGTKILEGEAVTLHLSYDIEKAVVGDHHNSTEEEEWF